MSSPSFVDKRGSILSALGRSLAHIPVARSFRCPRGGASQGPEQTPCGNRCIDGDIGQMVISKAEHHTQKADRRCWRDLSGGPWRELGQDHFPDDKVSQEAKIRSLFVSAIEQLDRRLYGTKTESLSLFL